MVRTCDQATRNDRKWLADFSMPLVTQFTCQTKHVPTRFLMIVNICIPLNRCVFYCYPSLFLSLTNYFMLGSKSTKGKPSANPTRPTAIEAGDELLSTPSDLSGFRQRSTQVWFEWGQWCGRRGWQFGHDKGGTTDVWRWSNVFLFYCSSHFVCWFYFRCPEMLLLFLITTMTLKWPVSSLIAVDTPHIGIRGCIWRQRWQRRRWRWIPSPSFHVFPKV